MAQHDYTIANQGFPAFRSDLNDALAAIVSNNSGATEPTTMFAHQMWVDTAADPSILKIRNADNDAWITIGTINQTGDTFTLTSAVSATTLNTSGAVVFNDAGADVDFRVEGDTDANLLFVDASADAVLIGTNTTTNNLRLNERLAVVNVGTFGGASFTGYNGANVNPLLLDFNKSRGSSDGSMTVVANADELGAIVFRGADGTSFQDAAVIAGQVDGTPGAGDMPGRLVFRTTPDGSNAATERMRIDSSGNLLVGKTVTSASASTGAVITSSGAIISTLSGSTNATSSYDLYSIGASNYRFYVGMAGTVFATNTTISAISDVRYKENIRDLDVGLAEVMQLQPRVFDWKEGKGKGTQNDRGFIAQEFEQVFPDLIDEWKDPAPEGEEPYKSVRQDLIPVLVKAIQELKAELDTVKAELATLKG